MPLKLPQALPILGYGLLNKTLPEKGGGVGDRAACELPLPALLSQVLLAFALDFERKAELSLAIGANVLGCSKPMAS